MIIIYTLVRVLITRRRQKQAKAGQAPPGMPAFGSRPPLAQQESGYYRNEGADMPTEAPPAYNQGIHLQQYPSTQSLPQVGQAPVQPRTMV